MAVANVIVNGGFDLGSTGWTGNDIEANNTENTYLQNGSSNRVAEMDGAAGQITTMAQSFGIPGPGTFDLSFRSVLRTTGASAGIDGFRVEVLNAAGVPIFSELILPARGAWVTYPFSVNFPAAGSYTLRFTEVGNNNSYGALLDDVSLLVCFVAGTQIETDHGPVPVESLTEGTLVKTRDAGLQPVRWISSRKITAAEQAGDSSLCPVVFAPGSLGDGLPTRSLAVSPLHRMLISDWRSQLYFAESEVLVPAKALVNGKNVRQEPTGSEVTYVHFLLDGHQIVLAEGVASESFYPSRLSMNGVETEARAELLRLFPDLPLAELPLARPTPRLAEARALAG